MAETCGPAYLGALETAIPYMATKDKLFPTRELEWVGEECWGEAVDPRPPAGVRSSFSLAALRGVELRWCSRWPGRAHSIWGRPLTP